MRNRIVLAGLALLIWVALKAIDCFVTGPEVLIILTCAVSMMVCHSIWLFGAQQRHRRKVEQQSSVAWRLAKRENFGHSEVWHPSIDIFISAKNESRVIENTVRNMFKVNYDNFLLWIIDDCSTDAMPTILGKLTEEFPALRVVNRQSGSVPGKSAALNEALAVAKGDVIAVFDADAYVEPEFFNIILPSLAPASVGAVQAQKCMYKHQKGFLVEAQATEYALDTYFQVSRDLIGGAVELRGNGQLVKREALVDVGGWNNRAITDDLDLSMRLLVSNWDISFCPEAKVVEEAVTTIKGLIRQRRRWAEGSIRRYLDYIFPLNSPTRLSLVERLDTLVFTVYFLVPALMLIEVTAETLNLLLGFPTHGKFLALVAMAISAVTQIDVLIAMRIYRAPVSFFRALVQSFFVTLYIYGHWVPVIVVSFAKIFFGRQVSTWHRTEHAGVGESALHT
jgi:1,2-diacylglycerol 3-beta-glucosyltransferase